MQHVDQFVADMARTEKDRSKRQKLDDLQLSSDEWDRVKRCLDLLAVRLTSFFISAHMLNSPSQHADHAQQGFSSEEGPSLHLALPALEAIQHAWIKRASRSKYQEFTPALEAGCEKVKEYFEKTADSEVYTFALCTCTYLSGAASTDSTHYNRSSGPTAEDGVYQQILGARTPTESSRSSGGSGASVSASM